MHLKKQSINGALWTLIDMFLNKGVYFVTTVKLAGIIGPEKFGLIGMITLFVTIGNTLIDSGMSTSLLRSKDLSSYDYSTVFITNVIVSIFVYFFLFLASPYIAHFYEQPVLVDIIRVYCLGFIISSIRSIHTVKLIREFRFKKIALLSLPGNIISVFISIYLAKIGLGIWSIVSLFLINQITTTIVFLIFIKWTLVWKFSIRSFIYHFNFGYKLVLSSLLNTVFENINNVLIGKYYNIRLLGYYDRAYSLNIYPVSLLSGIIAKVSLPTLLQLNDDIQGLQYAYKRIMQVIFFITMYCLVFSAFLASPIVNILLGREWLDVIPMFQILAISFVFYPLHSLNINILSLFGRSDLFLKLEVVKKLVFIVSVLIGFQYGIYGLVWSNVVSSILALIINSYYSGRFLNYSTINQLSDLFPTIFVIGFALLFTSLINLFITYSNPYIMIMGTLFFSALITIIFSKLIALSPFMDIHKILKEYFPV
jgi:O-antigen/teichoic acid export membrane protein